LKLCNWNFFLSIEGKKLRKSCIFPNRILYPCSLLAQFWLLWCCHKPVLFCCLIYWQSFSHSGYELFCNSRTWKGETSIFCLSWRKRWSLRVQPEGTKNCSRGELLHIIDGALCIICWASFVDIHFFTMLVYVISLFCWNKTSHT